MTEIPRLTTDRLILRALSYADWPRYGALMGSDRARYMGGPVTEAAAWGMFCADHAQWDFFGCGSLTVMGRETGAYLGQIGINSGPLFPEYEMGWLVFPEAEGQGFAFEAAEAMRNWARDIRRLPSLVSYIDPENLRSRRLAERLGARLDATAPRQDPADLVFRHF